MDVVGSGVGSGVEEVVGSGVELVLVLDVVMGATDDYGKMLAL